MRSKTDQEAAGKRTTLSNGSSRLTCPVRCLDDWRTAGDNLDGRLWCPINRSDQLQDGRLSDQPIALIIKRAA